MRNKQRYCGQLQNHVWIENFCGWIREITISSKYSYFLMVLWHGWSCKEVCGAILWVGEQDDSATLQSIYSMHRWPPLQRRRNKICWRIVKYMLSNCSQMFIFGKNWTTWYFMVSKQARTIQNKMDQSLWQTPESIDFIYSSYEWIQQYCHVGNTAKQCRLGLFQDSDFAGDLEDSKSTSGGTLCIFGSHTFVPISWMCKKQTSVSHSSTESEIISLDTGRRLDGLPALELWDLIVSVLGNVPRVSDNPGRPVIDVHKRQKSSEPNRCDKRHWFSSIKCSIRASWSFIVCVWRQWSRYQDDNKRQKSNDETRFPDPQSCSWLAVWSN